MRPAKKAFEQEFAAALRGEAGDWTPECLEPEDLLRLIEEGAGHPEAERWLAHLASCPFCRREYAQIRQTLQVTAVPKPLSHWLPFLLRFLPGSHPPRRRQMPRHLIPKVAALALAAGLCAVLYLRYEAMRNAERKQSVRIPQSERREAMAPRRSPALEYPHVLAPSPSPHQMDPSFAPLEIGLPPLGVPCAAETSLLLEQVLREQTFFLPESLFPWPEADASPPLSPTPLLVDVLPQRKAPPMMALPAEEPAPRACYELLHCEVSEIAGNRSILEPFGLLVPTGIHPAQRAKHPQRRLLAHLDERARRTASKFITRSKPYQIAGMPAGAGVLRELLEHLPRPVVRGGQDPSLGPRAPSPLFAVRGPAVTLRWAGPIDPAAMQQDDLRLRVRIRDRVTDRTILQKDLGPEARSFLVPAGTLAPGRWFLWSVTLVGVQAGEQTCGGPLRLLTPEERAGLERVEREAEAWRKADPAGASPDQIRARAYERLGLVDEALDAYESSLRFEVDPKVQRAIAHLRKLLGER